MPIEGRQPNQLAAPVSTSDQEQLAVRRGVHAPPHAIPMPPQEKHSVLTTRRDQCIPFAANSIEIGLVGEHRCRDPIGLLGHFHTLLIEQSVPFGSLSHSGGRRTCGSAPSVKSKDCGLFLQDSSSLPCGVIAFLCRPLENILGDRGRFHAACIKRAGVRRQFK